MAASEPVRLAGLTTVDAEAAQRAAEVAVLPVGAVEQHGPHLALLTDARIAEVFAARLAGELGSDALVCPLQPYGLSEHHERFAGTMTLTPPVFIAVMLDLVASLKAQGFGKVVIVNGHSGNLDALSIVARRARSELDVLVASMMWARLAREVCADVASGSAYGHACELETSLAMALAPELVRPDRIAPPADRPEADPLSAPYGHVDVAIRFDELTPDGVYGDPTKANPEIGERILTVALDRAVTFARRFARDGTVV